MLAIEVEFLTGRYTATSYNDRAEPEWPPHPARLFSALAATHLAEPEPLTQERGVLEWVESLQAPQIAASAASARETVRVFVPVNDVTVTGVDDEDAEPVQKARAVFFEAEKTVASNQADGKEQKRVQKELTAAAKRLATEEEKLKRRIEGKLDPRRISKDDLVRGPTLLPDRRGRQPRAFPSVTPEDPRVTYVWPEAPVTDEQIRILDGLASRVVRLGHSSSLVSVRVASETRKPTLVPDDEGELQLRVPRPNQLCALEESYSLHRETEPRVLPAGFQRYTSRSPARESRVSSSCFEEEWLVLRRTGGPILPSTAAAGVARAIRRVLIKFASEPVAPAISGHNPDGSPSDAPHLAVVPLPFVGSQHADGALLGVAFVLPRRAKHEDRVALYRALAGWEAAERKDQEDTPPLPVHFGRAGSLFLMRMDQPPLQTNLRSFTWCRPSRRWVSATPIALDRNPGDLHAASHEKAARAIREAEDCIRVACQRVGLPAPASVTLLPAAPLVGAAKARHFPPFPEGDGRTRRVLAHAAVTFSEPVAGPVLLGAGRYLGLGLFRPADDHD